MDRKYVRGISVELLKKLENKKTSQSVQAQSIQNKSIPKKIINNKARFIKKHPTTTKVPGVYKKIIRPDNKFLTSLANKTIRLDLPELGSFNAGMLKFPHKDEYILVYRPDEYRFIACILNNEFKVQAKSYFYFNITNCADPRLIWTPDNKLLMTYSSVDEGGIRYELIRGVIIMDLNKSENFIHEKPFRISPKCEIRHKNWMPFVNNDKIYFISTVCPHTIFELKLSGNTIGSCQQVYETKWINPWMFREFLRGNTPPVLLDDGNYLSTFHTVNWHEKRCFYDNGAYVFSGKPPFNVLKCANRTYLKAEDAIEPHFRKRDLIVCTFPVGMVKNQDKLYISYGDNDSCVKIMETTVKDMVGLMLDVY